MERSEQRPAGPEQQLVQLQQHSVEQVIALDRTVDQAGVAVVAQPLRKAGRSSQLERPGNATDRLQPIPQSLQERFAVTQR